MVIHLGNNIRSVFNGSFYYVQTDAKTQMAMVVRR